MGRRTLQEFLALAALLFLLLLPVRARLNGLPDRIPLNFDMAGHPNRWGSSSQLYTLPLIGLGLAFLLTVVRFFPGSFSYPVPVTDANRVRIQALAIDMIGWIKVELFATFAWLEWSIIAVARQGEFSRSTGPGPLFLIVCVGSTLVTIYIYISAMRRAANLPSSPQDGPRAE